VKYSRSKFLLILLLLCLSQALAQTAGPPSNQIFYTVELGRRAEHIVHVLVQVPAGSKTQHDIQLPVWNALYQIHDFSQYVNHISAYEMGSRPLPVVAVDKTTWRVDAPGVFTFAYDVVADNPGPFGAQVNEHHAFFNLAEILAYVPDLRDSPVAVAFHFPPEWKLATALTLVGNFRVDSWNGLTYSADNYDRLVDSPVEMGTFQQSDFEDGGTRYRVVVDADPSDYDLNAITQMARKLAAAEVEWMNDRPFDHYLFIFHFPRRPAGGGMEHAYSTAIDASADRVKSNPLSLAGVTAHEFFHLWNVKRIRPQSLEPVDYTKEQYTRALWFSEGVTSTVADYMRVRAGFLDEKGFLAELAADIRHLESRPARLTQSVEESSLDAWLEKYPQYESPQRSISYYNKGEILGMLLDLQMREASAGKRSLRDLFHWMNEHYAKQGKFFPDSRGVEEAAEAVTGADFRDFFARYVAGTDAIPYDRVLATVGLRLDKQSIVLPDPGFRTVRRLANVAIVASVRAGSDAEKAGLRPGDIIQQINGRAPGAVPENDLMVLRIGDTADLRVSGASGRRRVKFKLAGAPAENYALVEREGVTEAQRARRAAWIRGEAE